MVSQSWRLEQAWQAVAQGEATLNNTLLGFLGRFDAPFRAPAPAAATRNPSGTQGRRLHQNGNSYLVQGDFWAIRNSNMGVAPIHAQLTRYDKILMIDRRFYGSEAVNPTYIVAGEYDTQTNAVRNVTGKPVSTPAHVTFKQFLNNYRRPGISSNSWCSCGQALLGGLLINLGGGGDSTLGEQGGGNSVRRYQACNNNTCEINEDTSNNQADRLLAHRWYAAATLMPDGRILVTSGQDTDSNTGYHGDTFEIYPRNGGLDGDLKNMQMPINWNSPPTTGVDMNSRFLYPHVHLLPTGDWYLQQRNQWYVGHLEPGNSKVVKGPGPVDTRFSDGGTPTTYPSDGNSFLLPLAPPYDTATVVTCGATWSYFKPGVAADPDCIVITPTDATPVADRTKLKQLNTRIMVYCVYMLDGNLACLGFSSTGSAGYYGANAPVYQVDILDTNTMTFHGGALATVPRLYHGVATLIASGAIWTGGTNPQGGYQFQSDPANSVYPAELRAEVYYPWYFQRQRPVIRSVANNDNPHTYGSTLTISVQVTGLNQQQEAAIIFPGFSTHNQMYSQRYVRLPTTCARPTFSAIGQVVTTCTAQVPQSRNMAPPSDYLLTILDAGVPSEAVFIGIGP
ncbi:hypothetical protein CVIRNUC_011118 [Coccomyxa viridis]|uniref:Glyoxal or galactose oxidase n=1 Tax=Coccomyxa viridis TaxID=1274662 RepID=A0AAV1IMM6_9CHLO|nr:hypothetical protein CVIRNUC_011118 [Coccomyxa viridis]